MIRTQIQLTEEQATGLQRLAREQRVSMASVIRQSVDKTLADEHAATDMERRQRAMEISGAFRSGQTDIGTNHDKYLAEIYK